MAQVRHAATRRLELITEINNNKWRAFLAPSFFVINTQFILNESFARRREHGHPLPLSTDDDHDHDDTRRICREYTS